MFPFLRIGPLLIQMHGLALLTGLWVATTWIDKESLHLKLNATTILNMIFYGLIGGLIGARVIFAAQHLNIYFLNPLSLFSLNTGTLDLPGGVIIGVLIALLIGRREKLPLRPTLDALAPGFAVMMIAIGVANTFSGNAFGSATRLPWAIYLWGEFRHPTQIYETVAAIIVFIVWKIIPIESQRSGIRFLQVVAFSASARIFLEAFHGDSVLWPGGFRAVQIIGLLILTVAIYLTKQWGKAERE